MSALSMTGIGSGLDINSIVQASVSAQIEPKRSLLSERESDIDAKISALGKLKSSLSDFQSAVGDLKDASDFQTRSATSGNEDVFTASASTSAASGSYDIEVSNLASAQKLKSGAFADSTSTVGSGTLDIQMGGSSFSVDVAAGSDSLADVRDAINDAADNPGVSATIVNVDDGAGGTESRLLLTSGETGTANELTVTATDDDGNNTDGAGLSQLVFDPNGSGVTNMTEQQAAQDAQINIDGMAVTSSTNTITNAIDGVEIDLASADPGTTYALDVSVDEEAITESVQSFVDAYNSLKGTLDDLGSYNAESDDAGPLVGDATLRSVYSEIRQAIGEPVAGAPADKSTLGLLGIETDEYGKMSIDNTALNDTLENDLDALSEVFAGADGIATRLDSRLDGYLQSGGIFESRTDGLQQNLDRISDDQAALDRREVALEERLYEQFNAMDRMVAQLNSTKSSLGQALAGLPGFGA